MKAIQLYYSLLNYRAKFKKQCQPPPSSPPLFVGSVLKSFMPKIYGNKKYEFITEKAVSTLKNGKERERIYIKFCHAYFNFTSISDLKLTITSQNHRKTDIRDTVDSFISPVSPVSIEVVLCTVAFLFVLKWQIKHLQTYATKN